MTSAQIRQSFLDFFREKQHTIVPSSSLLPDAPNLLFTNAGMNQFVPIFLAQAPCPYTPGRAADTQKCIRAGGKHNDLEDVGFDTYHHTFFEMLGNWSFGDYFKQEAIAWAWELVVGRWKFPAERLFASVYKPGPGDPAEFDQEAYDAWEKIFIAAGLDPKVHIVYGNKKDNFWMMGDTGPCGPCSELHVDLTPNGDSGGKLVNTGDARCIEIWNLVFIQFNADGKGKFSPLPSKHVDTGMGFERVASMIQGTKGFTDFKSAKISNYETDVFRPLFDALEKLTGLKYASTLPETGATKLTEQEKTDVAFRVIADHLRTLTFSIADGITPSNEGRGYVLRRILRRAVRYGRSLELREPFISKLVPVLVATMSSVFPEIKERQAHVERTIRAEEESFFKTLERGLELFAKSADAAQKANAKNIPGDEAFKLHDTYGFPLDLTELMARERGMGVDTATFETLLDEQKKRSQGAQKKEIVTVSEADTSEGAGLKTHFVGYEKLEVTAKVLGQQESFLLVDETPFYAEMGGQVGDIGEVDFEGKVLTVSQTQKSKEGFWLHQLEQNMPLPVGTTVKLKVEPSRRARIEGHHSATHIMHWALREVLGKHVGQKGSYVGPDRLRFDFTHPEAMKPEEIAQVEKLVNERIDADLPVTWSEMPYAEVKGRADILQFFGDKYGASVRVVKIGDFSKELCGGTHVTGTGKIGYFKLLSEGAIAAGVRRIEAISGPALIEHVADEYIKQQERLDVLKNRHVGLVELSVVPTDLANAFEAWEHFRARQQHLERCEEEVRALEKSQAKAQEADWQRRASKLAHESLISWNSQQPTFAGVPALIIELTYDPKIVTLDYVPELLQVPHVFRYRLPICHSGFLPVFEKAIRAAWNDGAAYWNGGVLVIGLSDLEAGKASLLASVAPDYTKKVQAGKIIQAIAPFIGGKGGGRPELAQGGGNQPEHLATALAKVPALW